MTRQSWFWAGSSLLAGLMALLTPDIAAIAAMPTPQAIATKQTSELCAEPALSRLVRHRVAAGETLTSLAQRYNLIPATLMGMNPVLRSGNAPVGTEILIPPYNGIRVDAPANTTWRSLAEAYGVRADVLFEVNGCQEVPRVVFVPGVNWSPAPNPSTASGATSGAANGTISGYPLPAAATVATGYGWQLDPAIDTVVFHSGVDLTAPTGTPVLAAAAGTIAFVGTQAAYGNLIVINHDNGLQTRYAQLDTATVRVGQTVRRGDRIGTVGSTGEALQPHLHFEVRSNSNLGWVAQDPSTYIPSLRFGN